MTVITYRDGVLAADSFETHQTEAGGVRIRQCEKLWMYPEVGVIAAMTGDSGASIAAIDYYIARLRCPDSVTEPPEFDDETGFEVVILDSDGLWSMDQWLRPVQVIEPYFATGCGESAARGAMYMGATAVQAVEAAIEFSPYCGGQVWFASLDDL